MIKTELEAISLWLHELSVLLGAHTKAIILFSTQATWRSTLTELQRTEALKTDLTHLELGTYTHSPRP